jgi:hypothetical protein
VYTGDGELFDRNVETVTDNAEYRTGSVSAREVGWQTCPGVLFIGASLRIRIQVMTSFDRKTTRGASKRRAWGGRVPTTTLPAHSVLDSDYDNCEGDDSLGNNEKKKY